MTLKEAMRTIAEKNQEIRMLRDLKNDLLYYGNVTQCRQCKKYANGWCVQWQRKVVKDGYCNYGERK